MKLLNRKSNKARKSPRIEISEAEIRADLNYPASRRRRGADLRAGRP